MKGGKFQRGNRQRMRRMPCRVTCVRKCAMFLCNSRSCRMLLLDKDRPACNSRMCRMWLLAKDRDMLVLIKSTRTMLILHKDGQVCIISSTHILLLLDKDRLV